MRLIPAGHTELGFDASWNVGLSSDGEAVLCEVGSKELRKYSFTSNKYQMTTSKSLPRGFYFDCFKEVRQNLIYIQEYSGDVTYELSSADMTQQGTSQQKGNLIGYLPQHGPVYVEIVHHGYIINVTNSGILLRPPSGKWTSDYLSICLAGEELAVTSYYDNVLHIFNSPGKIFL